MQDGELAGTVMLAFKGEYGILKKMMLRKRFRGAGQGISDLLLRTAMDHCCDLKLPVLYLGTIDQFRAAHRFYEKKGFVRIPVEELPAGFNPNPVDDVFCRLRLI